MHQFPQYHDHNEQYGQEKGGGVRQKFSKTLSANSEPQLTGKTGHQLTKLLITVSQIVQFCTHVIGVEQSFNMLVSKDGDVIQCG